MSDIVTLADEASGGGKGNSPSKQSPAEQPDKAVTNLTKPTPRASTVQGSLGQVFSLPTGSSASERIQLQSGVRASKGKARGSPKPERIKLSSPRSSSNNLLRAATPPKKVASVGDQNAKWPDCVPDDVRERVKNYNVSEGFTSKQRPKKATSLVWFAGVWVTNDKTKEDGWICLADERCAEEGVVKAYSGASSNWVRHLETHHNMKATRGVQIETKKEEACHQLAKAKNTNWCKMGIHRSVYFCASDPKAALHRHAHK